MTSIPGGGADLDRWLTPFLEVMGRKTRRSWAPLYLRGLLGPGERKSLQPMAARLGLGGHDQLQRPEERRPVTTHPVRNRLPMLAPVKSNRLVGRMRLTISWLIELRKLRISSFFGREIPRQIGWVASTMSSHSSRAGP